MVNYHNHTNLCGHASGTMEDYVTSAINKSLQEFGFSDHAPVPLHLRDGISMNPEETESYINEAVRLKELYRDKIAVRVGFEVDYPIFDTFDNRYFVDERIDFVIGSVHYIKDWGFDNPDNIERFNERPIDDIYSDYYSVLESLVDSNLVDIIGHFDLIKKFGHRAKSDFTSRITTIAKKMAKKGIVAEINTSGLYKPVKEIYPSKEIVGILFKENVPVTLGSDSHSPDEVCRGYDIAIAMLKAAGYRKVSGFMARKRYDLSLL